MTPQADSGSVEGLRANPHRLRALLLEMATRCSVDMALWDAFSNEALRHADQVEALSTPPPPVEGGWRPIESAPKDGTARPADYVTEEERHVVRWGDWWQVHDGKFDHPLRGPDPAERAELSSDNPSKPTPGGDGRWTQAAPKTPGQADVREAYARIIAPERWASYDRLLAGTLAMRHWYASAEVRDSLATADRILALAAPPEGDRPRYSDEEKDRALALSRPLDAPPEGEAAEIAYAKRVTMPNGDVITRDEFMKSWDVTDPSGAVAGGEQDWELVERYGLDALLSAGFFVIERLSRQAATTPVGEPQCVIVRPGTGAVGAACIECSQGIGLIHKLDCGQARKFLAALSSTQEQG